MTVLTPRCQCGVCAGAPPVTASVQLLEDLRHLRAGTKQRVLSQLLAVAQHAVAQQAFGLGVAGGLHLPSDLGHRVQHVQFGSRRWRGKQRIKRRFEFVAQKAQRTANMEVFRTWVRLEVLCCFGQEVKHRLAGHLDFLKKGCS